MTLFRDKQDKIQDLRQQILAQDCPKSFKMICLACGPLVASGTLCISSISAYGKKKKQNTKTVKTPKICNFIQG